MTSDSLSARLRASFVAELEEQVRVMNADLLALERNPRDAGHLKSLFRVAHTLKGAARAAGVPEVEQACHALESHLSRARAGSLALDAPAFAQLFAAADALADAQQRLARGENLEGAPVLAVARGVDELRPTLRRKVVSSPAPDGPGGAAAPVAPEPPAALGAAPSAEAPSRPAQVRIDARTLDQVLTAATELRQARAGVAAAARDARSMLTSRSNLAGVERAMDDLDQRLRALGGAVEEVTGGIARLRMRPFAELCEGLPRMVRDLAATERKEAQVVVEGGAEEADRAVLDALREPIVHLVRNAVSQGIEKRAARAAAGKPRAGTITIAATLRGDRFVVTVADDGAGIDVDAARAALARATGESPADDAALGRALLGGGISTRAEAGLISGRGVGLDIVRTAVEGIGGFAHVEWSAGRGTSFTLDCPLTLASIRVVLAGVGGHVVAVPTASVERILRVATSAITRAQGREVLMSTEGPVPIAPLARVLGPQFSAPAANGAAPAMQLLAGGRRFAFVVDELMDECEITIRPLEVGQRLPLVLGAALTATGGLATVLNAAEVVAEGTRAAPGGAAPARQSPRRRVLVVDDSITTRTLEQHVLEAAGYETLTAVDGADAWRQLHERSVDLVVSDVEMPRMDGFALCRAIRASSRFAKLPVVLVTALESAEQRAKGLESGADAYLGKSSFDQQTLLDVIRQFLE